MRLMRRYQKCSMHFLFISLPSTSLLQLLPVQTTSLCSAQLWRRTHTTEDGYHSLHWTPAVSIPTEGNVSCRLIPFTCSRNTLYTIIRISSLVGRKVLTGRLNSLTYTFNIGIQGVGMRKLMAAVNFTLSSSKFGCQKSDLIGRLYNLTYS